MHSLTQLHSENKHQELFDQTNELIHYVEQAAKQKEIALHEVESHLWQHLLTMGHYLEEQFIRLCGPGDQGECIIDTVTNQRLKRFEQPHIRHYQSVFGLLDIPRYVYGVREGQKIKQIPLDARLKLPEHQFSYLLQDWTQAFTLEMPFAQVKAILDRILCSHLSVHSLERTQHQMAQESTHFWSELEVPEPSKEGALLVISNDGKGVPMRRGPREQTKAEALQGTCSSGPKPGTKKMALISAVYTIDCYVRTPKCVWEALFQTSDDPITTCSTPKRPEPYAKRMRGSLQRDQQDTTHPQNAELFQWERDEIERRDPDQQKPRILVMDGQDSLWNEARNYLGTNVIEVLDLMHACSYLWKAADLIHAESKSAALNLVQSLVYLILAGHVSLLFDLLPALADQADISNKKHSELNKILNYLRHNAHRMKYDEYLREGYPIASGVIEGACRCLVKDRMERSGMRWSMEGAQAMLNLRSIHSSGLWDTFISFRIEAENRRLYPYVSTAANEDDFEILALAG